MTRTNDQLAREWVDLKAIAARECASPFLLYVTADYCYPEAEIAASQAELERHGDRGIILWLPWRQLAQAILPADLA